MTCIVPIELSNREREGLARCFDTVADDYDAARPGYPEPLFDCMLEGLGPESAILELGSGSGIATQVLASRGYAVTCVEPGAQLLARARERLRQFSTVSFVAETFEAARLPASGFDLIFAAQSFHWLQPDRRLTKVSELLRGGGRLALFGNAQVSGTAAVDSALLELWAELAPKLVGLNPARRMYVDDDSPLLKELQDDERFTGVEHRIFSWCTTLSAETYGRLLESFSWVQSLGREPCERVVRESVEVVRRHGGDIVLPYQTALITARPHG